MIPILTVLLALAATPGIAAGAGATHDLVLSGVHVVDVSSGVTRDDRTLVIREGRIAEEGDRRSTRVPRGAVVVNGRGGWVIPGLWDMHAHFVHDPSTFPLYLAAGVTGVRDMGGAIDTTLGLRDAVAAGRLTGPRIVTAGLLIDGPKGDLPWRITVTDSLEAARAVDSLAGRGVDFIKVHNGLSRAAYFAVAARAAERRLPFTGHVPFGVTALEAVDAGQASLEHTTALLEVALPRTAARSRAGFDSALTVFRRDAAPALYARMAARGVWFTPTLVAARGAWLRLEQDSTTRGRADVPASIRAWWAAVYPPVSDPPEAIVQGRKRVFEASLELVRDMHAARVRLLAGTDVGAFGVLPGSSLQDELELLVRAGLTPAEALASATIEPARFLGLERESGSIAPGFRADLVLLRANPLAGISAVRGVEGIVLAGRWLPVDQLARPKARQPSPR